MIEFCLIVGSISHEHQRKALSEFCFELPEREIKFRVSGTTAVSVSAFWSESHPVHNFSDRIRVTDKGFMLLAGYALDRYMKPIISVDKFDPVDALDYSGDFFHLSVDTDGQVLVSKSAICSYQTYFATADGFDVLASRASMTAMAVSGGSRPVPNIDFARWSCTYGNAGNNEGVFAGSTAVLTNQSIAIENDRIVVGEPQFDFLIDHEMQSLFQRSSKKYWDAVFDVLVQSTSVLDFSEQEIDFPISGGKDSRLLLGLICRSGRKERIRRVFTNGPAYSPEVRSAKMVCETLGLGHEYVDNTSVEQKTGMQIDDKLLRHVHTTEGEMSPADFTWGGRKSDIIQLHGQEFGLRNIAAKRDTSTREKLLRWFDAHLANGDKCGLFQLGIADENMDEVRRFVEAATVAGVDFRDTPTLHRIMFRGRWVARTWRAYNDRFFAPYLFINSALVKATYNCGAEARTREDFHFEMLSRIAPELINVPLAGQSWDAALVESSDMKLPAPLRWPEGTQPQGTKNTFLAMHRGFEGLRTYLMSKQGSVTSDLLDPDRLRDFEIDGAHPSIYQALWNLVQIAILEQTPDMQTLATDMPVTELGLPSFNS